MGLQDRLPRASSLYPPAAATTVGRSSIPILSMISGSPPHLTSFPMEATLRFVLIIPTSTVAAGGSFLGHLTREPGAKADASKMLRQAAFGQCLITYS